MESHHQTPVVVHTKFWVPAPPLWHVALTLFVSPKLSGHQNQKWTLACQSHKPIKEGSAPHTYGVTQQTPVVVHAKFWVPALPLWHVTLNLFVSPQTQWAPEPETDGPWCASQETYQRGICTSYLWSHTTRRPQLWFIAKFWVPAPPLWHVALNLFVSPPNGASIV